MGRLTKLEQPSVKLEGSVIYILKLSKHEFVNFIINLTEIDINFWIIIFFNSN